MVSLCFFSTFKFFVLLFKNHSALSLLNHPLSQVSSVKCNGQKIFSYTFQIKNMVMHICDGFYIDLNLFALRILPLKAYTVELHKSAPADRASLALRHDLKSPNFSFLIPLLVSPAYKAPAYWANFTIVHEKWRFW